jgi:prenyltransferase beta subunit
MRQAARRAPRLLGESAELVRCFVRSRQNPDGGFQDRAGRSDLYYTVFGLAALDAFEETCDLAALENFLHSFGAGETLDFVHLTCLARCWSALPGKLPDATRKALTKRLLTYRAQDGGFAPTPAAPHSTAYACLLAGEALQTLDDKTAALTQRRKGQTEDAKSASSFASLLFPLRLGVKFFASRRVLQLMAQFRSADGAYSNEPGLPLGSTTATAAAVAVLTELGASVPKEVAPWLLARCQPRGGFCATPQTPLPDLLSTAVALHALAALGLSLASIKEPCLNFIDTLWDNAGGFHGHWADDVLDVEYTFYALLALGHLA